MDFFCTDFLKDREIQLKLDHTTQGNPEKGWVPAYYFNICNNRGDVMGRCDLRLSNARLDGGQTRQQAFHFASYERRLES